MVEIINNFDVLKETKLTKFSQITMIANVLGFRMSLSQKTKMSQAVQKKH